MAAADILGDIGLAAKPAVAHLLSSLEDPTDWVRRYAVEALAVTSAAEAVPRLASRLTMGECDLVRHNAALSLARIGPQAESALPLLKKALADGIPYVRGNAQLALASGSRL